MTKFSIDQQVTIDDSWRSDCAYFTNMIGTIIEIDEDYHSLYVVKFENGTIQRFTESELNRVG